MIWEAVIYTELNGVKSRQLVRVEADSFHSARQMLINDHGSESINVGPRQVTEIKDNNNNDST